MEDGHLLPQPVFALAERADPAPDRGDMLADAEVDPLHEGGSDVPTKRSEEVLDGLQGAKHTTQCCTSTRRRRRTVFTTCA